ncbi:MAG: hypothetical protein R3E12_17445, partial [Candidatus Eisenbacteria bacterium]
MSEAARDWSSSGAESPRPMRIEFATSELEGGPCRAWADPSYVLGAVAVSDPADAFTQLVQPRLEELDAFGGAPDGELPPIVTQLVDRLQKVHGRMVRENGNAEKPSTIALTCAAVEENRVFFVKTCPPWIGLVRDGRAHAIERPAEDDAGPPAGLGAGERLSLEVTSLPVEPGDIVLLLCSEMNAAPDLRAVANVFNQTTDLRRACDGLVNLLGLQSEGAGAIAFRFVPVGASGSRAEPKLIEELKDDAGSGMPSAKVEDPFAAMRTAMPRSSARRSFAASEPTSEAESFLDSLGGEDEPVPSSRPRSSAPAPGPAPVGPPVGAPPAVPGPGNAIPSPAYPTSHDPMDGSA